MRDPAEIDKLNRRFAADTRGAARFEPGNGGLTRLVLTAPAGEAHVYLYGAHVTHYQPRDQRPVLFLSEKSFFTHGRPIRGGVPVVFPWFGPRAADAQAPMHGFARIRDWDVDAIVARDESVTATFSLRSSDETHAMWPHDFRLRYLVTVGPELDLTLDVTNPLPDSIMFEQALHTYFTVADVRQARISGLTGAAYLDKNREMQKLIDSDDPLVLAAPTDRVYLGTRARCVIDDPAGGRRISVDKEGSDATVLWNPWGSPPRPAPDLGPQEWERFLCLETCNVKDYAVTLAAGATHTLRSMIKAEKNQ
ncbi:MAG TPA: D-hexose-6-phosphate mutarotase [Tepidisphaeraceae bacterium]|nr:D-hexose-6-phosphate mutarotase [Tepidisphaeraceae bacterium]